MIHISPTINEVNIPIIKGIGLVAITAYVFGFNNCTPTAPKTTGALKQNENLAASSLFIPRDLAAAIVVPLLEKPGIKANT